MTRQERAADEAAERAAYFFHLAEIDRGIYGDGFALMAECRELMAWGELERASALRCGEVKS